MNYIVVGLGNPGEEYRLTRHNAGFLVLDHLAEEKDIKFVDFKSIALVGRFDFGDDRVFLVKPLTYMNLSGLAVKKLLEWYSIPLSRVIIIFDDLSLPFGAIRLRAKGSSGGHKGLQSILKFTGEEIARLKIGIGNPPSGVDIPDFVLSRFSAEEIKYLPEITATVVQAVFTWIKEGTEKAMSLYNGMIPSLREGK